MGALGTTGNVINRHSNLIAGVLTLVAALLSIALVFVGSSRSEAVSNADDLEQQNGALNTQVNTLKGTLEAKDDTIAEQKRTIDDQAERIDQLEQVLEDDPESGGVPSADDPVIRNKGPLTLASEGLSADLNAQDDRWGAVDVGSGDTTPDLMDYYGALGLGFKFVNLATPDTEANYATCSASTTYGTEPFPGIDPNQVGPNGLCLQLNSGRYGALKVLDATPDQVKVHLTVWELE